MTKFSKHGPQDYRCPECGHIEYDVRADWRVVPEHRRLYKGQEEKLSVFCMKCRGDDTLVVAGEYSSAYQGRLIAMDWLPTSASNDLTSGGTGLMVDLGEPTGPRRFDSFREMHQHAAASQRMAANGEGAAVSFRALHQSTSNMDRNSLAGSSFETNKQIPHSEIGRTSRGREIGRGTLSREQAERMERDHR